MEEKVRVGGPTPTPELVLSVPNKMLPRCQFSILLFVGAACMPASSGPLSINRQQEEVLQNLAQKVIVT